MNTTGRFPLTRAALIFLALLVASCGGGEVSINPGAAETMDNIEVRGDETNLTISKPGGCRRHGDEARGWTGTFLTDGSEPWLLGVTIISFEAPNVYETSSTDESGMANVFLTSGAGITYESSDGMGGFTVDEGGLSGSLDVILEKEEDGSTVGVRGSFTCEDLS